MGIATQASAQRVAWQYARCLWVLLLLGMCAAPRLCAQAQPETVGRIEGADIAVRGQVSVVREGERSITILASGSEVSVRTGFARILLADGGEIGVCGPAQLAVFKSGGALTLALNSGRVRVWLEGASPLTIYTALVVATPLAIADQAREVVVGLEPAGAMCVGAARGAVRLEQQLTGLSLVVPERGEVVLPDGQLESLRPAAEPCRCEEVAAYALTAPKPPEVSMLAAAVPAAEDKKPEEKPERPKPPATEEPTWKVVMPPLTFDAATAAPPPEPSPDKILLIRELRVQPTLVFHGRVEPRAPAALGSEPGTSPEKKKAGLGGRIKNFFRLLFGRRPKK